MNKTELVTAVAEVSGKPKADVKEVLEALMGQIIKTVKSGDEVALVLSLIHISEPTRH